MRRPSIRAAIIALTVLTSAAIVVQLRSTQRKPLCRDCNVILISMDTVRADHLGCYGYGRATTPNVDTLAARSILFEDAISQSAWTRAAHSTMFTGLHPAEHLLIASNDPNRLPGTVTTLAGVLSVGGYATAAFTGGVFLSRPFGYTDGFEVFESRGQSFHESWPLAQRWLAAHAAGPFFLFLHGYDAHTPYRSDEVDRAALGVDPGPLSDWEGACGRRERPRDVASAVDAYDAAIHKADRALGQLFATLTDLRLWTRTVVIVTSDHGEEFFEHGGCFHMRTLYQEILRVPLIVHVPGVEPRRVAGVVPASASIAPTIVDLLGIGGGSMPAVSLADSLAGGAPPYDYVVSETAMYESPGDGHVRAISGKREKLIQWVTSQRYAYFDLEADPGEQHPVAAGAEMEALKRRLGEWLVLHPPRVEKELVGDLPQETRDQLERLGYGAASRAGDPKKRNHR